jgi:predicted amidophosphoribosyltransferase
MLERQQLTKCKCLLKDDIVTTYANIFESLADMTKFLEDITSPNRF